MTHIILVRHGQTAWNRAGRFRGLSDVGLSSTGQGEAHAAARRIVSTWQVDAVYTSPLKRAQETAVAIAQRCGLKPQPRDGLTDLNFGEWQGLTAEQAAAAFPEQYQLWLTAPQKTHLPGGETTTKLRRRVMEDLRALLALHPQGTIVLVSHQVVCKILALAMMGLPVSRFWYIQQDNAAINVFDYADGGFIIRNLNDTCHLREGSI
jgi:broad specificity phosphatase PhoE